jgi:chorismate mutase/prephenate dehydratase
MDLQSLRLRINKIDDDLIRLFEQRMDVSAEIARYKQQHNIPIFDPAREQEILGNISRKVGEGRESSITSLYSLLFELSRAEQEKIMSSEVV